MAARASALAASALILSFAGTASAQLTCNASATPLTARVEGQREPLGDVRLDCSGGTPTATGAAIPQVNITVRLSQPVAVRQYGAAAGGIATDALLLVNEPAPALQNICGAATVGGCGFNAPDALGGGGGLLQTTYTAAAGRFNGFQGIQTDAQTLQFLGVPLNAPGGAVGVTPLVIRITNLRAAIGGTVPVTATISTSVGIPINNSSVVVAYPQQGLPPATVTGITNFLQCVSQVTSGAFTVNIKEGFATASRSRVVNAGGVPSVLQGTPGQNNNTESIFVPFPFAGGFVPPANFGLADFGTRYQISLSGLPSGVTTVAFPLTVYANPGTVGIVGGQLHLVTSSIATYASPGPLPLATGTTVINGAPAGTGYQGGANSALAVTVPATGTVTAVYEVGPVLVTPPTYLDAPDPFSVQTWNVPVGITYTFAAGPPSSPATTPISPQVTVTYAPGPEAGTQSTAPSLIPAFLQTSTPQNTFTISSCSTITLICPNMASVRAAASPSVTINIFGSGFTIHSRVRWNLIGSFVTTTFLDATHITAVIDNSLTTQLGSAQIDVVEVPVAPALVSKLLSNAVTFVTFTILPPPAITSLEPAAVTQGASLDLVVRGQNFIPLHLDSTPVPTQACAPDSVIQLNDRAVNTFVASAMRIETDRLSMFDGSPGTVKVTVANGGGITSAPAFLTVNRQATIDSPETLPLGVIGRPDTPTTITASGGTQPYTWSLNPAPPGLTIVPSGTNTAIITGTPLQANTFTFDVVLTDASGITTTRTYSAQILPIPSLTFTVTSPLAAQQMTSVRLNTARYPFPVIAAVQVSSFQTSADVKANRSAPDPTVAITPSSTIVDPDNGGAVNLLAGVTAGTITICGTSLTAGGVDVSPASPPCTTVMVAAGPPVITCTQERTGSNILLHVKGFSTTRDVTSASFLLGQTASQNLDDVQLTRADANALFSSYYSSQVMPFLYDQNLIITGTTSDVGDISVVLANSAGTAQPVKCQ